jgi:DNA polymerase-1
LLVQDRSGLAVVADAIEESSVIGLDTETTGLDPRSDRVRLLSLDCDTNDGGRFTYVVDCFAVDPAPLWEVLAAKSLVMHHAAFDLGMFRRLGFGPGTVHDTMLLAQLLAAGTNDDCDLATVARRELHRELDKTKRLSDWEAEDLTDEQLRYAAEDAAVLVPLYRSLVGKIRTAGLECVAEIEHRCLPAVVWTAANGVAFDRERWLALASAVQAEADRLLDELNRAAPRQPGSFDFATRNWDSPAQVQEAFALAGIDLKDTNDETLASIDLPLAGLLRQYRDARKRCTTYGADWLKHVVDDGRVYAGWRQCGAKTGRMAAREPNLQNLPRALAYRQCFRPAEGRVLVKADYSQVELRIAAKVADETRMIEAYLRGEDLHSLTARRMTGRDQITPAERQLAKPVNFGLIYGLGAQALGGKAKSEYGLDLSVEDAERYRRAFFDAYPAIRAWHRRLKRRRSTETRTLSGRRVLVEADGFFGAKANYIVQGTGADAVKLALALLWERRESLPGAFPVLVVHDEIVVECAAEQADAAAAWLKQAMMDALAPLLAPVPAEVEVKVSRSWGGD